jgi:hypothetical protein
VVEREASRLRRFIERLPSPDAGPDALYATRALLEEVAAALEALPAEQRAVFVAHEIEGQSFRQIAEETGVGGFIVMQLWNWLLPAIFGWKAVTFWQALGLLALCRILFGGLGVGGARHEGRPPDGSPVPGGARAVPAAGSRALRPGRPARGREGRRLTKAPGQCPRCPSASNSLTASSHS